MLGGDPQDQLGAPWGCSLDSLVLFTPGEESSLKCLGQAVYSESHQVHQVPVSSIIKLANKPLISPLKTHLFLAVIMLISKASSVDPH